MAALKKGKKVINQDELRRLMREKQRQQQSTEKKKRVESPFAKYNSLGHLSCVLCNVQVKTELLWQAHILGKQHKEKLSELKTGSKQSSSGGATTSQTPQQQQQQQQQAPKRKAPDSEGTSVSGLPGDFFEFKKPRERAPQSATTTTTSAGLSLLAGTYDEDSDEEEEGDTDTNHKGPATSASSNTGAPEGLPADFFDSTIPTVPSVSHSGSILKADEQPEKGASKRDGGNNTAEALPEGFFDDPVRDAKVRNVEAPKDLMDKEWDEFQKEMRQVNTKSDAIVAEDDEEGRLERQIDEIDEQMECYRRVEVLRDKRDVVKSKPVQVTTQELSDQGVDEEDEEELLHLLSRDWRAKGALA